LLSRVLEQALLPPNSVQTMLPVALQVLYQAKNEAADDRLFGAMASVIQTLPNLSGETILQMVQVIKSHSQAALQITSRMQCVHALLHRGGAVAKNDAEFAVPWKQAEADFMNILAGM